MKPKYARLELWRAKTRRAKRVEAFLGGTRHAYWYVPLDFQYRALVLPEPHAGHFGVVRRVGRGAPQLVAVIDQ